MTLANQAGSQSGSHHPAAAGTGRGAIQAPAQTRAQAGSDRQETGGAAQTQAGANQAGRGAKPVEAKPQAARSRPWMILSRARWPSRLRHRQQPRLRELDPAAWRLQECRQRQCPGEQAEGGGLLAQTSPRTPVQGADQPGLHRAGCLQGQVAGHAEPDQPDDGLERLRGGIQPLTGR